MNAEEEVEDEAERLRILVVEDRPFQRRLIAETLRSVRDLTIDYAESSDHCLGMLSTVRPDLLITDWDLDGGQGLALVRRIRNGDAGADERRTPIVMVTTRNTAADVEAARNAGVDEFVLRPFSTAILTRRAIEVRDNKREFVESVQYVGPCRRRRKDDQYDGPYKRVFDARDKRDDAPDLQIRKGLARMYVERISTQLSALKPEDADGVRELCLACGQLSALAGDMSDRLLMSAASSLFNYVKGCGATGKLDTVVVQAHLDALLQLAQLPNYQIELRQTVTQQLGVLVTKKLRQAGAAA
jgi:CheY-like chemotaxis protein